MSSDRFVTIYSNPELEPLTAGRERVTLRNVLDRYCGPAINRFNNRSASNLSSMIEHHYVHSGKWEMIAWWDTHSHIQIEPDNTGCAKNLIPLFCEQYGS